MMGKGAAWIWVGICLVGGLFVGLGFPPYHLWFLVPLGIAGFVLGTTSLRPAPAMGAGFLFGIGFFLVMIHWMTALGVSVMLGLTAVMALWYALIGLVGSLTRSTPAGMLLGIAAWMGAEWASSRVPFGGFGWGRVAFSAADTPIDGLFAFISSSGVSFLIVLSGFCLAWIIRPLTTPHQGKGLSLRSIKPIPILAMCVLLTVCGTGGVIAGNRDIPAGDQTITVAVVQGNVPGAGLNPLGPRYTVENNHLAQTIILAAQVRTGVKPQPDFVAWPENSTATDPYTDERTHQIIDEAVDLIGAPILVGAITNGPGDDERQTTGIWWTSDGPTQTYAKRNLVPFGEWIPMRSFFLPKLPVLKHVGAQSIPGMTPGVLNVEVDGHALRVGDIICFEVAYDHTFDEMVEGDSTTLGGEVLIVQTSNATFTGTDQMVQQDAITRIRAMESGREILVSTTNSLAGLIDAHGEVVYEAQLSTSDAQVFTVPLRTTLTPAVRYRAVFDSVTIAAPVAAWLVILIAGFVRQRKNRRENETRRHDEF